MKLIRFIILAAMMTGAAFAQESGCTLFVSDGVLISKPMEVFINLEITEANSPKLKLISSHMFFSKQPGEDNDILPEIIAPHQRRIQNGIGYTGTVLIFNIRNFPIRWFQPLIRVNPVLSWQDSDETRHAIGSQIYIGNGFAVILLTALIVLVVCSFLAQWSLSNTDSFINLLLSPYGNLSLSKTQVALWTIAVGAMVFGFGMIKLEIPDIPESLLALMGLSLGTRGIISYSSHKDAKPGSEYRSRSPVPTYHFSDLICDTHPAPDLPEKRIRVPSLAKAQMLFWTVLMLFLFVMKSMLDGVLWEVPWEMVVLMGMSKAAYLTPDIMKLTENKNHPSTVSNNGGTCIEENHL